MFRRYFLDDQQAAPFDQAFENIRQQPASLGQSQKLHRKETRDKIRGRRKLHIQYILPIEPDVGAVHFLARFFDHELAQVKAKKLRVLFAGVRSG